MPNPIQYQQTSPGKSLLWKTSRLSYQVSWGRCLCDFCGCGADLLFVGNQRRPAVANIVCHCIANHFETKRHPTVVNLFAFVANQFENNTSLLSPDLSAKANTFWSQCHPSFCQHLLLFTKSILLSPALSDSQQKCAIADKILGISPKWANYESCFFCKYLQIQQKLFSVHDDSSILGAVSTENTYLKTNQPWLCESPDATTGVQRHPLVEIRLLLENGQDHNEIRGFHLFEVFFTWLDPISTFGTLARARDCQIAL